MIDIKHLRIFICFSSWFKFCYDLWFYHTQCFINCHGYSVTQLDDISSLTHICQCPTYHICQCPTYHICICAYTHFHIDIYIQSHPYTHIHLAICPVPQLDDIKFNTHMRIPHIPHTHICIHPLPHRHTPTISSIYTHIHLAICPVPPLQNYLNFRS